MGLETPTYVKDFNPLWPLDSDDRSEGAAHIRNAKSALQATFPATTADSAGLRTAADNTAVTSGTDTVTWTSNPPISAYKDGMVFWLKKSATANTGAVTLNGDSKGAGALVWPDGSALAGGDWPANAWAQVIIASAATPLFHLLTVCDPDRWTTPLIGEVSMYVGAAAPAKHLICNGGTIGDGTSGGTSRANADAETLFTLLWNDTANTDLAIQDSAGVASTRGANAAADFAAHKRMPLPDFRDYFPRGKSGSRNNLSAQTDAMQGHRHNFNSGVSTPDAATLEAYNAIGTTTDTIASGNPGGGSNTLHVFIADPRTDGSNGTPRTADETRPKNLAINFIIRYA